MAQSSSRIKQYHDNGNLWQYTVEGEKCICGCNVFHYEYDKTKDKVLIVCNACDFTIAEFKEEYAKKELSKGIWK